MKNHFFGLDFGLLETMLWRPFRTAFFIGPTFVILAAASIYLSLLMPTTSV